MSDGQGSSTTKVLLIVGGILGGVLVLTPLWGNHGLWLALILFMVARAITLVLYYPRITRGMASESV